MNAKSRFQLSHTNNKLPVYSTLNAVRPILKLKDNKSILSRSVLTKKNFFKKIFLIIRCRLKKFRNKNDSANNHSRYSSNQHCGRSKVFYQFDLRMLFF